MPLARNFVEDVYAVVRLIPPGRVTSYGAIAAFLGVKSGARMVGYALYEAKDVVPPVPAHRVLNRNGLLTGQHHFGHGIMQALLQAEGIQVVDDQVQNFTLLLWDPNKELPASF